MFEEEAAEQTGFTEERDPNAEPGEFADADAEGEAAEGEDEEQA